ncbi:MAG: hypothetical protein J2P48_20110 [Alphaproteobacteria bacterium]|nr:hypothetical protein [Alphaproteobacteria bacterium]
MADLKRPDRLQIMLNPEEITALDDWRFAHRMPSRAAAIRELLKRGLAAEGIDLVTDGKHSASFGVLQEVRIKDERNGQKRRGSRPGDREE